MSEVIQGLPYSICAIIADPCMSCGKYELEPLIKRQVFEVMKFFKYPLFYVFGESEFNHIVIKSVQKMQSCPVSVSDPMVVSVHENDILPEVAKLEEIDGLAYEENKTFEHYMHWIYHKADSLIYFSDINWQTPLPFLNLLYRFHVKNGTVYNIVPKLREWYDKPDTAYIDRIAANLEILDHLSKHDKGFAKRRSLVLKRSKSVQNFKRLRHVLENCVIKPEKDAP